MTFLQDKKTRWPDALRCQNTFWHCRAQHQIDFGIAVRSTKSFFARQMSTGPLFLQNKNINFVISKKKLFLQNTYFYGVKINETTNINL